MINEPILCYVSSDYLTANVQQVHKSWSPVRLRDVLSLLAERETAWEHNERLRAIIRERNRVIQITLKELCEAENALADLRASMEVTP